MGRNRKHNRHLPENLRLSRGVYYLTVYRDGKQRWLNLGRDYGVALQRYVTQAGPVVSRQNFEDMAQRYLARSVTLSKHTQTAYKSNAKALGRVFNGVAVADISRVYAKRYLSEHPKKPVARQQIKLLSAMLSAAADWGWIERNPIEGMRKEGNTSRRRYITDAEWQQILAHAGELEPLFRLAYLTALRRSDLLALKWSQVKDDTLTVTSQKSKFPHVFAGRELAGILNSLRAGKVRSLYLFHRRGRPLGRSALQKFWDGIRASAGIEGAAFHDIRRKRITDVTEANGREAARRLAGHTNAQTTALYYAPERVLIDLDAVG